MSDSRASPRRGRWPRRRTTEGRRPRGLHVWVARGGRRRRLRGFGGWRGGGRLGGGGGDRVVLAGASSSEEIDEPRADDADDDGVEQEPGPPAVSCEEHADLRCWGRE